MTKNLSSSQKLFLRLTFAVLILSLITMLLGPWVRAENAGLACPDWPLCKGKIIPKMDYQIFLEWIHRLGAGLLSVLFLFWVSYTFKKKELRKEQSYLVLLAIFLLSLQIALGALTVTELLDTYIVSSHLLNAMLFFNLLLYIFLRAKLLYNPTNKERKRKWDTSNTLSLFLLLIIFIQFFVGVRVSSHQAGRVCDSFPACYKEKITQKDDSSTYKAVYFPKMIGSLEKHMTHRFLAYFISLYILFLFFYAKFYWEKKDLRYVRILLILIFSQIIIGASNVILRVPPWLTVLHSTFAYLIYIHSFLLFWETRFVKSR